MLFSLSRALPAAGTFVCLVLAGCSSSPRTATASATSLKPDKERRPAPEFALKDSDGRTARLSDYRGKVVLLNFWATWCGPCKFEIPWLNEFEQTHKHRGFAVLGISMDEEGWDVVKPFVADLRVNYRVLMGDDSVAQLYGGVDSLPTSFLVDREGRVASVHVGLTNKSEYDDEIEELLSAPSAAAVRTVVDGVPALIVSAE